MNVDLNERGYALLRSIIDHAEQRELLSSLGSIAGAGRRGLLALPLVASLAGSEKLLTCVRPYLPQSPIPARAIFFDKSPEANWLVPWHQDLTIAVRKRLEVPGFGPWSLKDGIPHVQPPTTMLEQMLTVRIHLDDADESNGALRLLPGSHRLGRLSTEDIQRLRGEVAEVVCCASAGDALLMRPLLLHASGRSTSTRHRRVLHIEYAGCALPEGLAFAEAA